MSKDSKRERNVERDIDQQTKLENVKNQLGAYKKALEGMIQTKGMDEEKKVTVEATLDMINEQLTRLNSKSDKQDAKALIRIIERDFPEIKNVANISPLSNRDLLFTKKTSKSSSHESIKSPGTPPETSPRDEDDSTITSSPSNKRGGGGS